LRSSSEVCVEAFDPAIVQGKDVVLGSLDEEQALQVVEFLRVLVGEVPCLGPVVGGVQLPLVVVVRGQQSRMVWKSSREIDVDLEMPAKPSDR